MGETAIHPPFSSSHLKRERWESQLTSLKGVAATSARLKGHHMGRWQYFWRQRRNRTPLLFSFCENCAREARIINGEIQGNATLIECDAAPFKYSHFYSNGRFN